MKVAALIVPFLFAFLAACDPYATGSTGVRVSGSAAVGVSTGGSVASERYGGSGPPPGRTPAEREARKTYYQGPRGEEF